MGMFDKFPYRNTRDLNLNWIIKKIIELEGIVGAAVSDVAQFLSKKGGKMEGAIDMQNNRIFNVPTPAGDTDVTSKKYVDDKTGNYLPMSGGTMTGAVNMGNNKITSVATPTADTDVATKKYVDDNSGGDYLPLAGGTMTGAVNMGGNKITSVADPVAAQDVATKKYVDDHSGSVGGDYLPLAGGTMTGAVNMGGNKITSVATPVADTDVATKKYVDDHSGSVNSIKLGIYSRVWIPTARSSKKGVVAHIWLPFILTSNYSCNINVSNTKLAYFNGTDTTLVNVNHINLFTTSNLLSIEITAETELPANTPIHAMPTEQWTISK